MDQDNLDNDLDGDEGPKDEFVPPKDGSWVPKQRLDEATGKLKDELQAEREARIRLEEQFKATQTRNEPQELSRAQLRKAVEEEQLSQDEADEIWEKQLERKLEKKLEQRLQTHTTETSTRNVVANQMAEYRALIPDLDVRGTEARAKAEAEYQFLINAGAKPGDATELAAVRSAFGPVEKLKNQGTRQLETHRETGGEGRPEPAKRKGLLGTLSKREEAYYQSSIDKGLYPDWKAVEEELKYANPDVRRKMGANI